MSYLSSCLLSQRWRFWRTHSNVLKGIESDLACTKVMGVASQSILWSGSLWYQVRSSMLKSKWILLVVISKLIPVISTVHLDVAKNHINENVAKNNSRSQRGVAKSSNALNFGIISHSTILIQQLSHIISKTGGFGQLR